MALKQNFKCFTTIHPSEMPYPKHKQAQGFLLGNKKEYGEQDKNIRNIRYYEVLFTIII